MVKLPLLPVPRLVMARSGTLSPVKSAMPTQEALLPLLENCCVVAVGKVPIPELRKTVDEATGAGGFRFGLDADDVQESVAVEVRDGDEADEIVGVAGVVKDGRGADAAGAAEEDSDGVAGFIRARGSEGARPSCHCRSC